MTLKVVTVVYLLCCQWNNYCIDNFALYFKFTKENINANKSKIVTVKNEIN